ncbi:MAG: hypothetical protein H6Q25_1133 [Bacteroidetes bacterium]|nr:hypothetical protein [Bacteroidota bacterium]
MKINIYNIAYAPNASGDLEVIKEKELAQTSEFNAKGHEISKEVFDDEYSVFAKELYEYDEKGQLLSEQFLDYDGQLVQKVCYEYNENGNVVKMIEQYEDYEELYSTIFKFDGTLLTQVDHLVDDEFDFTEKKLVYENQKLIKEIQYDEYSETKNIITNKYNDKGLLIKSVRDEVKEKDRRTFELFYDDQNNKVKELIYNYKDKLIAAQYIRYDEKNREVESEWEDVDHYKKTVLEYDGDRVKTIIYYDKEGQITSKIENFYDENKNLIQSKRFEMDKNFTNDLYLAQETVYERVS